MAEVRAAREVARAPARECILDTMASALYVVMMERRAWRQPDRIRGLDDADRKGIRGEDQHAPILEL